MNETNLYHALLAIVFQLVVALVLLPFGVGLTEAFACGGTFAVGFYFGREVTQAEKKAGGSPWWIGFDVRKWSVDSVFDLLFPAVACTVAVAASALV